MSKKVLILGGGFAGVEAAYRLARTDLDVTLVSARDYMYMYPVSIWVPTHEVEFEDVCIPLQEFSDKHGFELIIDEVKRIDAASRTVELGEGSLAFDYLIIAFGGAKLKPKGHEHTISICGAPEQSLRMRDALDALVAKGEGRIAMGFGGNPKDTSAVRGGPAFEMMFNVHNLLTKKKLRDKFELTFFAPMPKPGARMGPDALPMLDMFFERTKVTKRFGTKIKAFEPGGVRFVDDSVLESDLVMFIPAGTGHPVVKASNLPVNEAGFVRIDEQLQIVGDEGDSTDYRGMFAVGDVAALQGPEWRAKQGHVAEVMAQSAVENILALERGHTPKAGYIEHINILCVMDSGDGAAFVYRDDTQSTLLPLPWVGHWLKKGWGWYWRNSKLKKIPRLPGM